MDQPEQSDLLSGVGITALGAAASRAVESHRPDHLIEDPFAAAFVEAARLPMTLPLHWPAEGEEVSGQQAVVVHGSNYTGLRSRYFDDYLLSAVAAGIGQVVILAAGLDARAFRLAWPPGVRLFEIDRPTMLEFKDAVLRGIGARARCAREVVAADLREDWPAALRDKGFDPDAPTAWLIEGLLPYLPAGVELNLFERVDGLSGPGSRLSAERTTDLAGMLGGGGLRSVRESTGVDMAGLVHDEPRVNLVEWLAGCGWAAVEEPATAVADRYHRDLNDPRLAALPGTPLQFGEYLAFLTASRDA